MTQVNFEETEFPGIVGFGPHEAYRRALSVRNKSRYDGGIIALASADYDYDVNANRPDIFAPYAAQYVPSNEVANPTSAIYNPDASVRTADTRYGYGKGRRHWMTLSTTANLIIKLNEPTAKPFRWLSANGPLVMSAVELYNLFLRCDQSGGTAQVQVIDTVAASALSNGKYFILYTTNASYKDKVVGVYVNKDAAGTVPTDARVTDWLALTVTTGDSNSDVAATLRTLLNGAGILSGYTTASVSSNHVTVTQAVSTSMKDAVDGPTGYTTGFTFNTPSTNGVSGQTATVDLFLV